jgi:hypothetical protein
LLRLLLSLRLGRPPIFNSSTLIKTPQIDLSFQIDLFFRWYLCWFILCVADSMNPFEFEFVRVPNSIDIACALIMKIWLIIHI